MWAARTPSTWMPYWTYNPQIKNYQFSLILLYFYQFLTNLVKNKNINSINFYSFLSISINFQYTIPFYPTHSQQ
jgi:hypothetical protein